VVIDPKRREMFVDLYRLAEYYERLQFRDGDIDGNAAWFVKAQEEMLLPFLAKYPDQYASDLAVAVIDEANRRAVKANNT
jgi:hypothetical protein